MSRRNIDSDPSFGSDSFLDIVANIVGILIILIVVAGVKVSHAPLPEPAQTAKTAPAPAPLERAPQVAAIRTSPAPGQPPRPAVIVTPSARLQEQVHALTDELSRLNAGRETTETEARNLADRISITRQQLDRLKATVQAESKALDGLKRTSAQHRTALGRFRLRLRQVQVEQTRADRQSPPVTTIRHKLTPVSHTVTGDEVHFRLKAGRVARVPIKALVARLKAQVQRQKSWLVKYHRHEGRVGPVRGFEMNYVVQRQQLSVIDELRSGGGMVRISVSKWRIVETNEVREETAGEALRPASDFVQTLAGAARKSTLTFWVYPDSFALYRKLARVAHDEDFTVAARPLPSGVPIAGSPHGSRSSGQ